MTFPAATLTSPTMGEPTFPPTMIVGGCATGVLIGGLPAAKFGATCMPHTRVLPPFDTHTEVIIKGSTGVFIEGVPAVRMTDVGMFGDIIVKGEPTVLIG